MLGLVRVKIQSKNSFRFITAIQNRHDRGIPFANMSMSHFSMHLKNVYGVKKYFDKIKVNVMTGIAENMHH